MLLKEFMQYYEILKSKEIKPFGKNLNMIKLNDIICLLLSDELEFEVLSAIDRGFDTVVIDEYGFYYISTKNVERMTFKHNF